jgi:hypothetical protein
MLIIVVAVVGGYLVLHGAFLTWRLKRPGLRVRQAGQDSARVEAMKRAAAANVAAVRKDANLVSPDAPGNYLDDL